MTEDNLFQNNEQNNENKPPETTQDQEVNTQNQEPFADQLTKIVNSEGKPKYDSVPKALEALNHSQNHITNLTQENAKLKGELEKLREEQAKYEAVEDVVARLTANQNSGQETPPQNSLDANAVTSIVQDLLNKEKQQSIAQQNISRVSNTLKEKFGDKAQEVLSKKATELGTSVEELGNLATVNPNMVLALFNTTNSGGSSTPTSSSVKLNYGDKPEEELKAPEKSLLYGASGKDQEAFMKEIKDRVYKRYDVTT